MNKEFKQYKRKGLSEMRPYILGEDMTNISVAGVDHPETDMGMVARNPVNHLDQWYVAKKYFDDNLELVIKASVVDMKGISFGTAIEGMQLGLKAKRIGWNGNGIFISISHPGRHTHMTQPYIYIDTVGLETSNKAAGKGRVPWLASQTDMLATDWELIK